MINIKKTLIVLVASLMALSALCAAAGGFAYKHDPSKNPYAMQDIVADESAVYGFRPTEEGSLKMYADADWSDPTVVESGRQDRIAYHESIEAMYTLLEEMTADGRSAEEIARAVSAKRNEIRLAAYENDPEGLLKLKARNLEKYGHEEGPLPDELYAQYGSWEAVTQKAFSVSAGMDACLGLYDDYYEVYVALGQAEPPEPEPAPERTGSAAVVYVVAALAAAAIVIVACALIFRRKKKA
ncbi:MAG: hypothetical protein IJS65_01450 [Clostridia bacterium]|nr:hypothetical protein [Clostridia bacterium]